MPITGRPATVDHVIFDLADRFPPGTEVAVHLRHRIPGTGVPTGAAVTTATVDTNGTVVLLGLRWFGRYVLHAVVGGEHRIVSFTAKEWRAHGSRGQRP